MKKLVSFLMIMIITVLLCACGDNATTNPNENSSNTQGTVDSSKDNTPDQGEEITEVTEAIVRAYKTAPASDFEYEIDGEGILITEYKGDNTIVVIPDKIDGKPVTGLDYYLFANDSAVKGVFIPETVLSLEYTFTNNDDIQVVICEGIESVQDFAFANCANLYSISLGDNLKQMGQNCISVCPNLKEIEIPSSLKDIDEEIAWSVFYACKNLTVIGESGSYIENFCNSNNISFKAK